MLIQILYIKNNLHSFKVKSEILLYCIIEPYTNKEIVIK